ncbi:hypothetical protein B0H13DRAFT_2133179 [Mycena leptocephala]|nr:hypothetical protein B0H13DRAFT_2133179 [Mycena leptocephala]
MLWFGFGLGGWRARGSSKGRRDDARRTKHVVDVETERGAIPLLSGRVASRYFRVQIFALFPRIVLPLVIRYAPGCGKFRALALPFLDGFLFSDSVFIPAVRSSFGIHRSFQGFYSRRSLPARDEGCSFIFVGERGLSFVGGDIAATAIRAPSRPYPVLAHRPPLPASRPHYRS